MSDFSDLVQMSQQLIADTDVPRMKRNLQQINDSTLRLAARAPTGSQDNVDVKAAILLGSRGFDTGKVSQKLETLSSAKTFEPLEPVRDTDIQGFLRNERENALLAVIEQARKNTFEESERRHWDTMESEWEREKQKILNALVVSGQEPFDFSQESESVLGNSISMQGRSTLDSVEMAYSRQVYVYNDKVVQGGIKPSLVKLFSEVVAKSDDQNVQELWRMVEAMTDVPLSPSGSLVKARNSPNMQASFVQQAMKYLQQIYVQYLRNTVYSHLQQAQLGGIPGTFNLVRSFLNVHLQNVVIAGLEGGRIDGHPGWAVIYYCMRCGDLEAAQQAVNSVLQHLGDFPRYFLEYCSSEDGRLNTQSEREVRLLYRRSIRNCTDPFKKAVYCIIGKCDPRDDHSEVASSTEDYLWIKLGQVTFEDNDGSSDKLSLSQLQTLLLEEFGEAHFSAYQQPFLYFRILFLTGQFEAAVEFLSRIERLRCHAVHVAIALYELNLLLQPYTVQAQLLSKESAESKDDSLRRLNFARLIMMYTRKFSVTDPREALQYFYFLREKKTSQGDNLFTSCVSELVLETREFDMLLGQLAKDGSRRPGALDKFKLDTQGIIETVANDTESKGLYEDAVRLYDLAKKYDKVLSLCSKLLSEVVSQPPAPQSNKDRRKQLALSIAQRYKEVGAEANPAVSSTFHLLLDLTTFFDLYHGGKHEQAYKVIQELNLLPFKLQDVDNKVKAFQNFSHEIRQNLPDVLLTTMNIIYSQYKTTKGSATQSPLTRHMDGGKQTFINYLRVQARSLITFAGMLPFRLPGDTNARLVQLEVLMN
ncbi:hypothetical protein CAPTEDRAFT_177509 [Capitella teleta]|uniref:Nuclear pore protein n=1 Tax=Capitella teleta TaxID=283909 RepID=R7TV42_CAPTE|nr:hypothetical protein CAPTEDRAFT_177509 [Capitella teleta]|eukprot:ELT94870.1 hypothetical protein CAPTEDRAFT_177509 [Capitella teleta]